MARQDIETVDFDGTPIHLIGPSAVMMKVLEVARRLTRRPERMALLIGDQGIGKTLLSRYFATQHRDVIYLQIPPAEVLSTSMLLRMIENKLGMAHGDHARKFDRVMALIEELRRQPRMLIFDNANRMAPYKFLDVFRYIHDEAGVRICFISVPALRAAFTRHPEFAGRIGLFHHLKPLNRDEVALLFPRASEEAISAIHQITGGRMREVLGLVNHFQENDVGEAAWTAPQIEKIARAFTIRGRAAA